MKHKAKNYLMFAVGLAVTAVALWYSTRQVKLKDFVGELKGFHAWWLIPGLLTFYYSMYLRAVRWGLFFRPYHTLKGYQIFRPMMICFGFNCLLPGRIGEIVRAWLVGTRQKTGVATALATVVAERIVDSITLISLLAFSLAMLPPMDPAMSFEQYGYTVSGAQFNQQKVNLIILSLILVIGMIVFMLPLTQRLLHRLLQALPLGEHLKGRLRHMLDQFAQGFHALQRPGVLVQILFHSILLWVLIAVSNLLIAKGFNMPMTLAQAIGVMVIIGIFITIPASPGYWGLYEAGTIFGLIVLRIVRPEQQSLALAYALVIHLVQYIPIVLMGILFAWQMQMRLSSAVQIAEQVTDEDDDPAASAP